jgi:hypothetical protein
LGSTSSGLGGFGGPQFETCLGEWPNLRQARAPQKSLFALFFGINSARGFPKIETDKDLKAGDEHKREFKVFLHKNFPGRCETISKPQGWKSEERNTPSAPRWASGFGFLSDFGFRTSAKIRLWIHAAGCGSRRSAAPAFVTHFSDYGPPVSACL